MVCPAQPPIAGVLHYGFPCDNVMAVEEVAIGREPRPWAALVDCRPMLLGWDAVFSTADAWSFGDISVGIEAFCPPHWHPRILGERASSRRIPFRNGQVFTAVFARDGSCGSRDLSGVGGRAQEQPDLPDATNRDRSRSLPPGAPAGPREADQAPGIASPDCLMPCSNFRHQTKLLFGIPSWTSLQEWAQHGDACPEAADLAASVILLLDPELCAILFALKVWQRADWTFSRSLWRLRIWRFHLCCLARCFALLLIDLLCRSSGTRFTAVCHSHRPLGRLLGTKPLATY